MRMHNKIVQLTVAVFFISIRLTAQTITPDVTDTDKWKLINRTSELVSEEGKKAIRLREAPDEGYMVLKNTEFSNGTIEFDVKGKNIVQQSFVGFLFHGVDEKTYDAVYFRPFNFSNADTARRRRAVQYVSMPGYPWEKLRETFPGKYEDKVDPAPDPDGWFHVRLIVADKKISVFVNNAQKPSLEVEKLTGTTKGGVALWVGNNSGGSFANVTITSAKETAPAIQKSPYGNNPNAGKYFNTGDVKLYYEVYGAGAPILLLHGGVYGYIDEFENLIQKLAETYKVICLATRAHGKSEIGNQPFTYKQRADDAHKLLKHLKIDKAMVIGFSDGGYSAYKMAALYPESVSKMIVMGAGDMNNSKREKFAYSEVGLMKESGKYFRERRKLMPQPERWNESLIMLNDLYNKDFISTETFKKIKCPVLLMAGDADAYSSAESMVSCFRQISNVKLSIIPNCGHVILYCNFPAIWESMKGFISGDGTVK